MTRDEKQDKVVEDIVNVYKAGGTGAAIQACTGFGKTMCGIKTLKRFSAEKSTHVVVPRIPLKEQWEEELRKHCPRHNVEVFVINTYLAEDRQCDFLILDEAHRYSNDEAEWFNTVIDKTSYSANLCLSATFTTDQLLFLSSRGISVVANISIHEATIHGWVSRSIQYNLSVSFTPEEQEEYTKMDNIMRAHSPYFDGLDPYSANKDKLALARYCNDNGLDYKDVQMRIARWTMANGKRKSLVYGAANKIAIIPSIIQHIGKKAIVFSETKIFAETVQKSTAPISTFYHSGLGAKAKLKALSDIKDDTVKIICAARALDEGVDVPSLKCAIIASGTSVERQQIQRIGRVNRFITDDDIAIIINLYVEDTIELSWLKKRQKSMPNIRWIQSVSQIENE
jgi:superfamily II DNA or RNA helicase